MGMKIWEWKRAVQQSSLSRLTKLVLYNLSFYMDEEGRCFPSIVQQMKDCSMCRQSIIESLQEAWTSGFLSRKKASLPGQSWARNEYQAIIVIDGKVVYSVDEGGLPSRPARGEGGLPSRPARGEGGLPSIQKAVYPVDSNLTKELNQKKEEVKKVSVKEELYCDGVVLKLSRPAFDKLALQLGLPAEHLEPLLEERDGFLAGLSQTDPRRARWWFPTLRWLEKQALGVRAQEGNQNAW